MKVTHREFPVIFMIMLNKYQVDEKKKTKEFVDNLQVKYSYRRLYGESGLKGVKNTSIFRFNCGALGETVKCPSFYKFENLGRGLTWRVTFSIIHNHHKAQRTYLSRKAKEIIKKILICKLEEITFQVTPDYEAIMREVHTKLLSMGEDKDTVRAVVTRRYISSRFGTLSTEYGNPKNFSSLLLKPFEELKTDKHDLDHMKKIKIILPPQVLSSKAHLLPRMITRSMCSKFEDDNKVNSIPQENNIVLVSHIFIKTKWLNYVDIKGMW